MIMYNVMDYYMHIIAKWRFGSSIKEGVRTYLWRLHPELSHYTMQANIYVVLLLSLQLQVVLSGLTPPQQKNAMATSGGDCQLSVMDLERSWEQYSDTSWTKQYIASTRKRVQESATSELKDEQMIKYEGESS